MMEYDRPYRGPKRAQRPSQKSLVKEEFRRAGFIQTYEAVYHLTDPDGRPHRITRLAAIIWDLRHKEGWNIETTQGDNRLATYTLKGEPVPPHRTVLRYVPLEEEAPAFTRPPDSFIQPPRCPHRNKVGRQCGHYLSRVRPSILPNYFTGHCPMHGERGVRI